MNFNVERIEYFNITVEYRISDASKLLTALASGGIDFLAYKATSTKRKQTVFTLFCENAQRLAELAAKHGFKVQGPYSAVLAKGDEQIGALAAIYDRLSQANIDVNESSGIAHINGGYGVILYMNQENCEKALQALRN